MHFPIWILVRSVVGVETYRYDAAGRRVLAHSPTNGNIVSQYTQDGRLIFQSHPRGRGQFQQHNETHSGTSLIPHDNPSELNKVESARRVAGRQLIGAIPQGIMSSDTPTVVLQHPPTMPRSV